MWVVIFSDVKIVDKYIMFVDLWLINNKDIGYRLFVIWDGNFFK